MGSPKKYILAAAAIIIVAAILFLGIKYFVKFKNNTQEYYLNAGNNARIGCWH